MKILRGITACVVVWIVSRNMGDWLTVMIEGPVEESNLPEDPELLNPSHVKRSWWEYQCVGLG